MGSRASIYNSVRDRAGQISFFPIVSPETNVFDISATPPHSVDWDKFPVSCDNDSCTTTARILGSCKADGEHEPMPSRSGILTASESSGDILYLLRSDLLELCLELDS